MINKKYFGTDGIRGKVGESPIDIDFFLKLGWAVGSAFCKDKDDVVVIGTDTRSSCYMLESALVAGLSAAGVDMYLLGTIPTPAIAYLTTTFRAKVGIVISASHNPFYDNGIKFFSASGLKLSDETEHLIEEQIENSLTTIDNLRIGKVSRVGDAVGRYIEFCKSSLPHYTHFKGLKIIVDCANGATYTAAPKVFRELQAEVQIINNHPNGLNINENCGSMHPEMLRASVLKNQADVGIAFDGDGDRVCLVDSKGEYLDGDDMLFILAKYSLKKYHLEGGVIGTTMTNAGLEISLQKLGIPFERTSVGDEHVLQALRKHNWLLGGEPSGHIVCLELSTTCDGIIAALQILKILQIEGRSLHELKNEWQKMPQFIVNVPSHKTHRVLDNQEVIKGINSIERRLQGHGRLLVRPSGTEPVIRVMVEGEDSALIKELAIETSEMIKKAA